MRRADDGFSSIGTSALASFLFYHLSWILPLKLDLHNNPSPRFSTLSILSLKLDLHNSFSPRFSILSILPLKLRTIYWPAVRVLASFPSYHWSWILPLKLDLHNSPSPCFSTLSILPLELEPHSSLSPRFSILSILLLKLCTIYWPVVRVLESFPLPLNLDLTIDIVYYILACSPCFSIISVLPLKLDLTIEIGPS